MNSWLLALIIIFLIQLFFFVLAASLKTDKFTDLAYGITFVILAWFFWLKNNNSSWPLLTLTLMISAWGFRLAIYLLIRILKIGKDQRFEQIRKNLLKLAGFWGLQTVSIFSISFNFLLFLQKKNEVFFQPIMILGFLIWLLGFSLEAIADYQKFVFKNRAENKEKWIENGLWAFSRHPNYLGEMLCWWGVYFYTLGALTAWQKGAALISPFFITFLLLKVSGIPLLEKKYNKRYLGNKDYLAYKKRTPLLLPQFGRIK